VSLSLEARDDLDANEQVRSQGYAVLDVRRAGGLSLAGMFGSSTFRGGNFPLVLFTQEMLALLRYRRIAHRFIIGRHDGVDGLPQPKVALLPTFYLQNDRGELEAVVDSTPLIRRFENEFTDRSVVPPDPVVAFIDYLLEDYADEWLTKAMFHYRWVRHDDITKSATVLPNWMGEPLSDARLEEMAKWFSERQIGRLKFVGSNEVTGATIEAGYQRLIAILERHGGIERAGSNGNSTWIVSDPDVIKRGAHAPLQHPIDCYCADCAQK